MTHNAEVHDAVRNHYGAIARAASDPMLKVSSSPSCCSSDASCGCSAPLYDDHMVADLPYDVTGISLGCGDPVTIAGLQPGETVLDLGSGGGIDCFLAAKQVGETGYVIGVDMTPEMLEKANANKAKLGANNVEFRKGQIEALPVEDNRVDVLMSNCVINLSPDKAAVFREAVRVLKPGGRVSISDIVTEGEFTQEMRADASMWAGCVSGAIDAANYTRLMEEAGFLNVQIVDKTDAGGIVNTTEGGPRIFSARITANKPLSSPV